MVPSKLILNLDVMQRAQKKHRNGLGAYEPSELDFNKGKVESWRQGKRPA